MAKRAEIKAKISLDKSKFEAGARSVQNRAKKLGKSILKIGAAGAAVGIAALGAAAVVAANKMKEGVLAALEMGGALSDLRERTGIAVNELMLLQRAFQDAGVSADKVGPSINKMQKSIMDLEAGLSTQVRAFERLGMVYSDIKALSPGEQFETIARALTLIQDPTERSATAMEIFGRSGAELMALFQNGAAFDNARESLGGMADLMDANADKFDRAADIIGGLAAKGQQFFTGVASALIDDLLPALEHLNEVDLTNLGVEVGEKLAEGIRKARDELEAFFSDFETRLDIMKNRALIGAQKFPANQAKKIIGAQGAFSHFGPFAAIRKAGEFINPSMAAGGSAADRARARDREENRIFLEEVRSMRESLESNLTPGVE